MYSALATIMMMFIMILIMKMIIHVTESVQGLSSQLVNIILQSLFPINDEFCFKEKENVVLAFSPFNNNTSNA